MAEGTTSTTDPDARGADRPGSTKDAVDRRCLAVLLASSLFVYAWFFQGAGDNQKAHFNTIRAVVEAGQFSFLPEAHRIQRTDDVSRIDGRTYSNKPPGLPLLLVPVYAPIHWVEQAVGLNPDDLSVYWANQHVVTMVGAGVPAAVAAAVLFVIFRRQGYAPRDCLLLAGSCAFGTLLFPYAGALKVHNLNAMSLIVVWALLTGARPGSGTHLVAGLLLGLNVLANYLFAPIVVIFAVLVMWLRRRPAPVLWFCLGPMLAVAALLTFHAIHFGHPLNTSNTFQPAVWQEDVIFLGMFELPDLRRLYWLTVHPNRGLFYFCPVLVLGLLGLVLRLRRQGWADPRVLTPALLAGYFLFVNLCFNGWGGGWAIGARYLIPTIPLLMLFAPAVFVRHRRVGVALVLLSVVNMFAVTAVRVVYPGNGPGRPLDDNPVAECIKRMTMDQVARQVASYNLGMKLGLEGVASTLPALAAIVAFGAYTWRVGRPAGAVPETTPAVAAGA